MFYYLVCRGWLLAGVFIAAVAESTQRHRQNQTENESKVELRNVGNEGCQETTSDHTKKVARTHTHMYMRILFLDKHETFTHAC